jgi:hypothetical protein
LSIADETYADKGKLERPGTTIEILSDDINQFALIAKKVVSELEKMMDR